MKQDTASPINILSLSLSLSLIKNCWRQAERRHSRFKREQVEKQFAITCVNSKASGHKNNHKLSTSAVPAVCLLTSHSFIGIGGSGPARSAQRPEKKLSLVI